ncbi:hypothetical protein [Maridesulfovibrio sp.]|uniref:hypothetical protein n=1 Tax=Maridesulfovibrio sp. TaxID=2795000 RepID=UPI002A186EA0|nr:hypothetical protein [Maridesulfovibrio sp.]
MNALAKLQDKYRKPEPETPYCKFKRLCRQEGKKPISEEEFNREWQTYEAGHEAMKTLGGMMREHRTGFKLRRNMNNELAVVIDEAWGRANAEIMWQMWELYEKAMPLIALLYIDRLPLVEDEQPKRMIEGRLPLGPPQQSTKHG